MKAHWIVLANASRARFFSQADARAPLEEINDLVNSAVRLRTAETEQDRLGTTAATKNIHNTGGAAPGKTYEPHQTPAEHETESLARSVAAFLLRGHQEGRFGQLTLVASPQFLGVLRKQLDPQVQAAVAMEINKDYTQATPKELLGHLQAQQEKGS